MAKEVHPRFRCVLCGALPHYSQLEKAPYELEIKGSYSDGFQNMKYTTFGKIRHRKQYGIYKEFLAGKIVDIIDDLGIIDDVIDELEELGYTIYEEIEKERTDEEKAEYYFQKIQEERQVVEGAKETYSLSDNIESNSIDEIESDEIKDTMTDEMANEIQSQELNFISNIQR